MPEKLVDPENRTVSSKVFTDSDIFAQEQDTVFTHSWLYLGHRNQVEASGDFMQTYAGTKPLLLCRSDDGKYHAIANVCAHRGSRICQVEFGRADKFVCPYHNWVYNNRGDLLGVPRRATQKFDKSRWHLVRADRVDTYADLIFATFSNEAPPLEDFLGEMRWYLDLLCRSSAAGTQVSAGTHRSHVRCNWKIPAEQFGSDNWHFQAVHGSFSKLGGRNEDPDNHDSFHVWTPQGHMLICVAPRTEIPTPYTKYLDDLLDVGQISHEQRRLLRCTIVLTIFPNLSFVYYPGLCSIRVWHPRSPNETELWSWALYNKDAPDAIKQSVRNQVTRMFSPTGMLEQDDLEVWSRLGANLMSMPPTFRLCYGFDSADTGEQRTYPGRTTSLQSDRPAFSFYRQWNNVVTRQRASVSDQ